MGHGFKTSLHRALSFRATSNQFPSSLWLSSWVRYVVYVSHFLFYSNKFLIRVRSSSVSRNGQRVCLSSRFTARRPATRATSPIWRISRNGTRASLSSLGIFAWNYLSVLCTWLVFYLICILMTICSRSAGASSLESQSRMSSDAKQRAQEELEGRTGETDSEEEGDE